MKKFFLTFIIFYSVGFLHSQTLTLEEARLLALANSRSLARYELSIRTSVLDERNQLYNLLPSVNAGYSASVDFFKDWEFVNPSDTFRAGADLSITQIIFQGGKGFVQKAISSIATESVRIDALAEYFNVLDSVDNAYYALLEAGATLEAEESFLESAILSLAIAEIRHSSGIISPGDYLKAQADKEARENSRNQARRNLVLYTTRLRSLTGITGNFELEQINFDTYEYAFAHLAGVSDEYASALYDDFRGLLLSDNPSLAKAQLNNRRAQHNLSITQRDYAPTISATVFSTGLTYTPSSGFNSSSSSGLTIRGSIPLDFWVMNNRVERNKIAVDSAELDYSGAQSSLEIELQSALFNLFAQAESVLSTRRSLEYTEQHFEYVMERYRLSQSSVSDMSDAFSLIITSRNNHIKARYGFLQSLSRLRSLCAIETEDELLRLLL